jgi:hypothetical protein
MIRFFPSPHRVFILIFLHVILTLVLESRTTVNTIGDLRALSPGSYETVTVLGYYEPGDWGEPRIYNWTQPSAASDNGGTVIIPSAASTGRWIMIVTEDYYNVKWFGARGQDNPDHNDHLYIMNCIEAVVEAEYNRVFIPKGIYQMKTSINITARHNGFEFFGDTIQYTSIPQASFSWGTFTNNGNGFKVVDESESSVIKRADSGTWREYLMRIESSEGSVGNITIRDLAFNGNFDVNPGWHNVYGTWDENAHDWIRFIDVSSYNANNGGINLGGNWKSWIENSLVYNVSLDAASHGLSAEYMRNVEVWGSLNSGINIGEDFEFILDGFDVHHNKYGMKSGATAIEIYNGVFRNNQFYGFSLRDSQGQPQNTFKMDNVEAFNNGSYGFSLSNGDYPLREIGKLVARRNSSGVASIKDTDINELIVEENRGTGLRSSGYVTINKLISRKNGDGGVRVGRGDIYIKSGEIYDNSDYGIVIVEGGILNASHIKFGDIQEIPTQTFREIYGDGTLYYSGLDFTESVVSPENRIRVDNAIEIANATIISPYKDGRFYKEDSLEIEVLVAAPNAAVQRIEFYANDIKIGEVTQSPFVFRWEDMEEGEYILKAVATFSDNTQEVSNNVNIIVRTRNKSQQIILNRGVNTVSTYVQPDPPDIFSLFAGIKDNLSLVKDVAGKVYWPSLEMDEIETWNHREGYQVYMEKAETLVVTGLSLLPEETPVYLTQGWNMTAYILDHSLPIENALKSIGDAIHLVTNNDGNIYWPEMGVNTIGYLSPGQGYNIFAENDAKLIYPDLSLTAPKLIAGSMTPDTHDIQSLTSKRYQQNHRNTGVTAILLVESQNFINGDEIGVWTEAGILVGSGTAINGRAAITVWGHNTFLSEENYGAYTNESLRLTMWSSSKEHEYPLKISSLRSLGRDKTETLTLLFIPDEIFIVETVIDNSIPQRYSLEQNFPNPFNPATTIRYVIPRDEKVTLTIYNLLGQRIATLVDDEQSAGTYEVLFKAYNLASGIYFYRLVAGMYTEIRRMTLLR